MCILVPPALRPPLSDAAMRVLDRAGFEAVRRDLVGGAAGATLEIGAGTGGNLAFFPQDLARLVITEPNRHSARRLRRRVRALRPEAEVVLARAEALPFPDAAFDTVVATLVLCSVPDPAATLGEIRRVLRPGGSLLFAEHVRAPDPALARRQDRMRRLWGLVEVGCRPNRDTVGSIEAAGFTITRLSRGTLPAGPALVRPLATGRAERPGG